MWSPCGLGLNLKFVIIARFRACRVAEHPDATVPKSTAKSAALFRNTCASFCPFHHIGPSFGSVVFFAPLRFVLRSLGVALRLVSVVKISTFPIFSSAEYFSGDFFTFFAFRLF
jgi:hypothetical protein